MTSPAAQTQRRPSRTDDRRLPAIGPWHHPACPEDPAQQAAVAVAAQPGPAAPAGAAGPARGLRPRFRSEGERELRGYGVWLFVGLVFGVPESWRGFTSPPWPALSDTIGHLEQLRHPVRVIVVACADQK